jgi:hypothetical protein
MQGEPSIWRWAWTVVSPSPAPGRSSLRGRFIPSLSLPFILGISVVLIPGLAVRRHVTYYKTYKEQQLKQEKARLYAAYRKFADTDAAAIIHEKKELSAKMNRIQDELEKLKAMRNSHLDG